MSGCRSLPEPSDGAAASRENQSADARCVKCESRGPSVARRTVLHHVRHEHLDRVKDEDYRFCPEPGCAVVYYGEGGTRFTVDDLRELVTVKASGVGRPLCYCFGFKEGDAREEIARTGTSTIPARISRLIKAGMCACEVRNPSGACCLGQVNQIVKRLSEEYETAIAPAPAPALNCDPH